jgi:hypothetical protein
MIEKEELLQQKRMADLAKMIHCWLHLDNKLEDILRLAGVPKVSHSQLTNFWFWIVELGQ